MIKRRSRKTLDAEDEILMPNHPSNDLTKMSCHSRTIAILASCFVVFLLLVFHSVSSARAAPLQPAKVADAIKSVVVVLPRWQNVRPGFAPRTPGRRIAPEGSGVAILPGGYIVTNDHVLGDPLDVRVRLADGRQVPAMIVGRHKKSDIALLKINDDLPILVNAPKPGVAEPACAIGNPFGRGISVSCGVVSAVHRANAGFNDIEDFVQTDAAVNPGGSGGALVDGQGRFLGMVSAIFAQGSDANLGINFAASSDLVHRVASDLKEHGHVIEGNLGLFTALLNDDQIVITGGVAVVRVDREGPALTAGIEAGDIITAIADRKIGTPAEFRAAQFLFKPGDTIKLSTRRGETARPVSITMAPPK